MARTRRSGRNARSGTRAPARRKPRDWVSTLESWDDAPFIGSGPPQLSFLANEEITFPLVNTYSSWMITGVEDTTLPPGAYSRGLPWLRRTVVRVRGWLHFWSPDYYTGNMEAMFNAQIQRFATDRDVGTIVQPTFLATDAESADETVYWRHQRWLAHSSSWTTPDDFASFRGSVFIDRRLRVMLDEEETLGMRLTWKFWSGSGRLNVRSRIRTQVESG